MSQMQGELAASGGGETRDGGTGGGGSARGLHWIAWAVFLATFPLIFMGGLVTSHKAGMSVPDWPNSYGYNMFLFPPSQWVGGIFYEHTHRLMGTVAGFCSVLLVLRAWGCGKIPQVRKRWAFGAVGAGICAASAAMVLPAVRGAARAGIEQAVVGFAGIALVAACAAMMRRREERRWVRWLATSVLGMVVLQGILGGLRVVLVDLDLAVVHACVAQAFFCLAALMVVVTSRWWTEGAGSGALVGSAHPADARSIGRGIVTAAWVAVGCIYLQLIAGALMRHFGAGLAIPDVPLAYGHWLPPVDAAQMDAANQARVWKMDLPAVTLAQVWIHFTHRLGAVVVTLAVGAVVTIVLRWYREIERLFVAALLLCVLILTQVTLGLCVVIYRKPADVTSLHVAVGALCLVTTFVSAVWATRMRWLARGRAGAADPARVGGTSGAVRTGGEDFGGVVTV